MRPQLLANARAIRGHIRVMWAYVGGNEKVETPIQGVGFRDSVPTVENQMDSNMENTM